MSVDPGPARQGEVYLSGMMGGGPCPIPFTSDALRDAARERLSAEAFAYADGGAGEGLTMRANREALDRVRLVPRMARGVETRDFSVDLFGRRIPAPLLIAPIGVQELAHPDADLATARAAAAEGVPMIFSNQASVSMEETAAAMGSGCRWFQLYWSRSDALVASLLARAEAAGCEALVVTLDTPMLGWRPEDLALGHLPFLHGKGIAQYTSDPVFRSMLARPPEDDPLDAARLFMTTYSNPAISWDRLPELRRWTTLPILVKGILCADDARAALDAGMDGIIVSNHGGRQVDGSIGAADALARVADAVSARVPVLFDSGIRSGADVLKAQALGARAVLVGRPVFNALAVAGEEGVRALLRNLVADHDLSAALSGCRSTDDIDATLLDRARD